MPSGGGDGDRERDPYADAPHARDERFDPAGSWAAVGGLGYGEAGPGGHRIKGDQACDTGGGEGEDDEPSERRNGAEGVLGAWYRVEHGPDGSLAASTRSGILIRGRPTPVHGVGRSRVRYLVAGAIGKHH